MAANYVARQELQKLDEAMVTALEQIASARADISTLTALISKRHEETKDEGMKRLEEQAKQTTEGLDALEKQFRNLPETRGIVYDDDKISNKLSMAAYYVQSNPGEPTPTAGIYIQAARKALEQGLADVNAYMAGPLSAFRTAVTEAGIGLLRPAEPVAVQ